MLEPTASPTPQMKHQRLREERVLPRAACRSCRPMMTAPGSLTHTPALGGHPPLSSLPGPWALPRDRLTLGRWQSPSCREWRSQWAWSVSMSPRKLCVGQGAPRTRSSMASAWILSGRDGWRLWKEAGILGWGLIPEERRRPSQEERRCQEPHQSPRQPQSGHLHSGQDLCWETEGLWA